MKTAQTQAVDAQLTALGLAQQDLGARMVTMTLAERNAVVPELIALSGQIAQLNFERAEIIRQTFFRGTRA